MINKRKVFAFILAITFVTLTGLFISLKKTQSDIVKAQNELPKLTLELSSVQDNYVQLEPVAVKFKLSNQTDIALGHRGILSVTSPNVMFSVRSENGEVRSFSFPTFAYILSNPSC